MKVLKLIFLFCLCFVTLSFGQRIEMNLSSNDWKLSLDPDAAWQHDKLYAPPVDISLLPVNLPTGGWNALNTAPGVTVHLPATVEQYYWGYNGQTFGVTGNYVGVSWFTTTVVVPQEMQGKRIFLDIESVRFRAEIFVNHQLVGYDLVNSTPFEIDITNAVQYGKENHIAFRITDPNGNFNWKDSQTYGWGDYRTNPTHGFGGITGKVFLIATDQVYIDDIFVKNKPKVNEIDVEISLTNRIKDQTSGKLLVQINENGNKNKIVYSKEIPVINLHRGENVQKVTITLNNAKLWSVESPSLYELTAIWKNDNTTDSYTQRFGFRWFEVRDVKGDKQYYLNGKRIVLRSAISWSFWPDNGIAPSDELAKKQIVSAKTLGLNMLNFHRTIGYRNVLDYADELGLLYFEEPGGNQYPANLFNATDPVGKMQADFYFATRTEKLSRMIKRDRSHPSLIIYNLHNERGADPQAQDYEEMRIGHRLDETRIMTYNSCNGNNPTDKPDAHFKLHLLPYDTTFYDYGWYDRHHAGGPGVYHDNLYNTSTDYLRYTDHKDEIIFWGEDGAIGTPPRLQLIRDEILKSKKDKGWEADDYIKWYEAYDSFLKTQGFSKAFPNVDSLTRKMGNVAYYYQGRVIENIRINNITDGYAVNGWESMKLENHSGIVDNYRNLKGDPGLIAHYNQPLFVSVKIANKVLSVGDTTTVDFFIVNESDLKGKHTLRASVLDEKGNVLLTKNWPVKLTGGSTYGELLFSGWRLPVTSRGYTTIKAELLNGKKTICRGNDNIYAVELEKSGIQGKGMVADTSGVLSNFLSAIGVKDISDYQTGTPEGDYLLVGNFEPQQWGSGMSDIMEWVYSGNKLIIVGNVERWAEFLADKEVLDYRGAKVLGKSWYGGNYFAKEHPLLEGLPVDCVFNWEYQCFAAYNRQRIGLRNFNGETVVACVSDHKKEVYSALSVIPAGRGTVILCSLDVLSCIRDLKPVKKVIDIDGENASINTFNMSGRNKANVVGQQLLLNMLRY